MWILILGFGWSAAGIMASVLVTQLGFPYTWVSPLTLGMIGVVLFLVYRGYAIQGWLLAGCLGFIVIAAMAFARALTEPEPAIPELYRETFESADLSTSLWGYDLPIYSDESMWDYTIEYSQSRREYLIAPGYDRRTLVTIEFPPLETPGGQWAFVAGSLHMRGAVNATVEAQPGDNWLGINEIHFVAEEAERTARPELSVLIPLPMGETYTPITTNASLTVVYPQADGTAAETTLRRDLTLRIIGDDYYLYYDRYTRWERSHSVIELPLAAVLVAGVGLASAGAGYLLRQGAHKAYTSGGLMVVVRRLSGTQKLGVEVLPLEQFRDRTSAEQGVFVGRVNAQSPAGRAGLRTGDVLIELDGKPINNPGAVKRMAKGYQKGQTVPAVVLRGNARVELRIRF